MAYKITDECTKCGECVKNCPVEAIKEGETKFYITEECVECGLCADVCPVGAVVEVGEGEK